MKRLLLIFVTVLTFSGCQRQAQPENNKTDEKKEEKKEEITYDSVVSPASTFGRATKYFFYDVKQVNVNPISTSTAADLYGTLKMNGIRVPIFGDQSNGGHTGEGIIGDGVYDKVLTSIQNARNAYSGDKFIIFASKKLDGDNSFPDWVKDSDGIIPEKYAVMLFDYIKFMQSEGYAIDILGIDNETNFNEGNITAEKYARTIDELKKLLKAEGLSIPKFVAHERYNPEKKEAGSWLKDLYDKSLQDRLDIYATHYYPKHHNEEMFNALKREWTLCNSDKKREFWATEPHWDNDEAAKSDMLAASEKAICALFDQTDLGMDAFMWWGFKYDGDLRAGLMKNVSEGIYGAQPVKMTDKDGEDILTLGKLQTRAFAKSGEINIYMLNVSEKNFGTYKIKIDGTSFNSINATQWNSASGAAGSSIVSTKLEDGGFCLQIPAKTITRIKVKI